MATIPRYRKTHSVSFSIPDGRPRPHRMSSFTESDWDFEPTISTISPTALAMVKKLRTVKTYRRSWDSDNALKCTYKGLFGKYQIRAYIFLVLGYSIVGAWLTEMPTFALLPPKFVDCTPYNPNVSNLTDSNRTTSRVLNRNITITDIDIQPRRIKPMYNYSKEYGRSVLTDFDLLCDKSRVKIPYIAYIIGLILGGLIFGYMADYSGRKMVLLGSMWTACALSVFQLLSDDYISYVFFILFLGIAIGAVHVITIPYVMEMFPTQSRVLYGLSLLGAVFLLDLVIPWLALGIKNWKILQAVVTIPLIVTVGLYWFAEESMFWYTSQKDYISAILSLTRIAQYNGIVFEDVFRDARTFLHGKSTKGTQCDFQPLLRLEDFKTLSEKYQDFDMVDLQEITAKKKTLTQRLSQILTGQDYLPTSSMFYPTDFIQSSIVSTYLLIMCGLWLVNALTEYSLDAPQLTQHLSENFFYDYFYSNLIQVLSFIVAVPLIYRWGRRWPTFCFFLLAEVCLLGSVAIKLDDEHVRSAILAVYFIGKFATRAAFIVIVVYTCEIFPTGLRCTTLGICYTFRLIGIALASPNAGELNGWMPRLIYGILSLIIGALALLLPETKIQPLPRTMQHVENIPTAVSTHFRQRRSAIAKRKVRSDGIRPEGVNNISDTASVLSGMRSNRPYDNQSTLHSIYELQDFAQDDTIHSVSNRFPSRRMDLRSPSFYQPYGGANNDLHRQESIAENDEYDDRRHVALQRRLTEQKRLAAARYPNIHTNEDVIIVPITAEQTQSPINVAAGYQGGVTATTNDEKFNSSPRYQRAISQEENYFSEHC